MLLAKSVPLRITLLMFSPVFGGKINKVVMIVVLVSVDGKNVWFIKTKQVFVSFQHALQKFVTVMIHELKW